MTNLHDSTFSLQVYCAHRLCYKNTSPFLLAFSILCVLFGVVGGWSVGGWCIVRWVWFLCSVCFVMSFLFGVCKINGHRERAELTYKSYHKCNNFETDHSNNQKTETIEIILRNDREIEIGKRKRNAEEVRDILRTILQRMPTSVIRCPYRSSSRQRFAAVAAANPRT